MPPAFNAVVAAWLAALPAAPASKPWPKVTGPEGRAMIVTAMASSRLGTDSTFSASAIVITFLGRRLPMRGITRSEAGL